ncbi:hypothetical protein MBM_02297 [Drepanopeziza brunnea f. sp. 'multigermtubi' MB_m1]|uniref:Uncharacterized protein n=1 Tax=Marssonina brunnea f. sp. multigermtubi (strain MB_m1) TaxID=1072389 RepID=K1WMY8_MARBU|nr:uncharacterized protein MBM_02297 [Drepanopeziza brunnea f. sp. 'multigermtubi' MB_m1]EKD19060.1 hypothetical protein MBM_02297 [Drepanopeziza brunnea f. sp. 'multigermtubi' MB_m1]
MTAPTQTPPLDNNTCSSETSGSQNGLVRHAAAPYPTTLEMPSMDPTLPGGSGFCAAVIALRKAASRAPAKQTLSVATLLTNHDVIGSDGGGLAPADELSRGFGQSRLYQTFVHHFQGLGSWSSSSPSADRSYSKLESRLISGVQLFFLRLLSEWLLQRRTLRVGGLLVIVCFALSALRFSAFFFTEGTQWLGRKDYGSMRWRPVSVFPRVQNSVKVSILRELLGGGNRFAVASIHLLPCPPFVAGIHIENEAALDSYSKSNPITVWILPF